MATGPTPSAGWLLLLGPTGGGTAPLLNNHGLLSMWTFWDDSACLFPPSAHTESEGTEKPTLWTCRFGKNHSTTNLLAFQLNLVKLYLHVKLHAFKGKTNCLFFTHELLNCEDYGIKYFDMLKEFLTPIGKRTILRALGSISKTHEISHETIIYPTSE